MKHELTQKAVGEELENFNKESMKPVDVTEKNILPDTETHLPDAEDIKSEKDHLNLLKEVETGRVLSPVVPKEPFSGVALLKQELTHQKVLDGVSAFDKDP